MRKIIIGDIHGCFDEFQNLLKKVEFQKGKDQLYSVGDLINRGPSSKEVYQLFKEMDGKAVLGNHEYNLIKDSKGIDTKRIWIEPFKEKWGEGYDEFIQDIKTWPFYLEEEGFIIVHAGLVEGVALENTDPLILTTIRTWDGKGKDLKNPNDPAWFDLYQGEKLVVFGHWAALEGVERANIIGLDSGCAYGKKLSCLILPTREIVTVKAAKAYCPIKNGMVVAKS